MIKGLAETVLYLDLELPVEITSDKVSHVSLGGIRIELKKGLKLELPLRVAYRLLKEGHARPDLGRLYSLSSLSKIRWKEEKSEELQRIDSYFYFKLRLLLQSLRREAARDEEKIEELRRIKAAYMDILRRRLHKISKLAIAHPEPSREHMQLMTPEEKVLYVTLCDRIMAWVSAMQDLVEGSGEMV